MEVILCCIFMRCTFARLHLFRGQITVTPRATPTRGVPQRAPPDPRSPGDQRRPSQSPARPPFTRGPGLCLSRSTPECGGAPTPPPNKPHHQGLIKTDQSGSGVKSPSHNPGITLGSPSDLIVTPVAPSRLKLAYHKARGVNLTPGREQTHGERLGCFSSISSDSQWYETYVVLTVSRH